MYEVYDIITSKAVYSSANETDAASFVEMANEFDFLDGSLIPGSRIIQKVGV